MTDLRTMAAVAVISLLVLPNAARAAENPDVARLSQRLTTLDANPGNVAAYERLQARQAVSALEAAKRSDQPAALQIALMRVDTAETATRTEAVQQQLATLERTRSELLIEASQQDAARARQESERLRIQSQIQAEEATRLQEQAAQETAARQDAETALSGVADDQTAKLNAARAREAELAKREAELTGGKAPPAKPKKKPRKPE